MHVELQVEIIVAWLAWKTSRWANSLGVLGHVASQSARAPADRNLIRLSAESAIGASKSVVIHEVVVH